MVRLTRDSKNLRKKKRLPIRVFVQCMLRRSSKSECFFFKNEWSFKQFQCKAHFCSNPLCFRVKKTQKCTSLKICLKNQFNFSLPNLLRSIVPKPGWSQRRKQISQHACEKNTKCLRIENCFKITNKYLNLNFKNHHFYEKALV